MIQITFAGLERWYVHIFENVGWKVLSINECNYEINYFKKMIHKWSLIAKEKLHSNKLDKAQIEDLIIMIQNVIKLHNFIKEKF
jgi:hypothetical protein